MKRREFIAGLGSAAAWPMAARAQQRERVRRIGVLMPGDQNDFVQASLSAFTQELADLGWTDGRNVRMDVRWAGVDPNRIRALAQELVALQPDIILAGATAAAVYPPTPRSRKKSAIPESRKSRSLALRAFSMYIFLLASVAFEPSVYMPF